MKNLDHDFIRVKIAALFTLVIFNFCLNGIRYFERILTEDYYLFTSITVRPNCGREVIAMVADDTETSTLV